MYLLELAPLGEDDTMIWSLSVFQALSLKRISTMSTADFLLPATSPARRHHFSAFRSNSVATSNLLHSLLLLPLALLGETTTEA